METAMDQDTIISLRNVCKGYRSKKGIRRILDDVSFDFRGGENLAILGGNGSGKSVLLRMICGMELPDSGTVQRAVSISYPLGFAGGISSNMTGRDNVRFIARIYGCDVPDVERFVYDFSELGRSFDLPVVTYANSMRARLSYGISMALRCDVYVVDEMAAVGDVTKRQRMMEHGKIIKQLEEEGDVLYAQAVGALFERDEPAIEVLKWKEIFDSLEEAIDECEDVSNVLESIALKNS